jgi:hypothetical protein
MRITKYVEYIKEARKRGFGDLAIRNSLLEKGWPLNEIDLAFSFVQALNPEEEWHEKGEIEKRYASGENKIVLYIDDELLAMLEKRAKKNLLTLPNQVEDILRRSTLSQKNKKNIGNEKIDDKLVGLFSRKKTGPKKKHKKKKHNAKKEEKKKIRKARRHKRKIVKEEKKVGKIEKKVKRKSRRHMKKK